jgi:protein TonB
MHRAPTVAPPPEAPPPPSEAPPKATDTPPVFGVSLDSTVGDGPGMAVPVGNTLMTKPHKAAPVAAAPAATGDPDRLPAPVPEVFISEPPRVLQEVTAAYPAELQRMGIEGHVTCKLYIDETGAVRRVTVIEKAGHGFDELARDALKKFKFSPARTSDGKAVPTNIVYKYKFELPQ